MTEELNHLNEEEKKLVINAPALLAVYSALYDDGHIEDKEKSDAVRLAHLRTFTSPEVLHSYYEQVDKHFEEHFDEIVAELPDDKDARTVYLEKQLKQIGKILSKIDQDFASELALSLKSFSRHVFRANSHFLEYFLLPGVINHIEKSIFAED